MHDAFRYLPDLRDRVTPPDESELRVTAEVLAFWNQRARDLGRPANWRLSDQEIENSRRAALSGLGTGHDLWIYGYGSLMWDPGFHFAEVRLADLQGYQRRFSYRTTLGRGCPEQPGLMLSLEQGPGCCRGLAFRVAADMVDDETTIVWRREMIRGGYRPALLPVSTPQGEITALAFAPNLAHPDYVGELPLQETAAIIARGAGVLGTNRQYLENLVAQIEHLDIDDAYMTQLLEQVRMHAAA
jgi:glutathione-specific gamma-glutamylcyclotransferase